MNKTELLSEIKALKEKLEPLEEQLRVIYKAEADECQNLIDKAHKCQHKFKEEELTFAAYNRCKCGAGFAYPENVGVHGAWYCSDILLGIAEVKDGKQAVEHTSPLPFAFYSIKSDNQPSAQGASTRRK